MDKLLVFFGIAWLILTFATIIHSILIGNDYLAKWACLLKENPLPKCKLQQMQIISRDEKRGIFLTIQQMMVFQTIVSNNGKSPVLNKILTFTEKKKLRLNNFLWYGAVFLFAVTIIVSQLV